LNYSILFFNSFLLGQETVVYETSSLKRQLYELKYKQDRNIFYWIGNFNFSRSLLSNSFFSLSNSYNSNLLTSFSEQDKWKDQNRFNMNHSSALTPSIDWTNQISSNLFLDKQTGFNNDIHESWYLSSLRYNDNNISFTPSFGWKWEKRFNQNDRGYFLSGQLGAYDKNIAGYNSNSIINYSYSQLDGRQNRDVGIGVEFNRLFYNETADTLDLRIDRRKKDYYINSLGQIETREEAFQSLRNTLWYVLSERMKIRSLSSISFGEIDIFSKTPVENNSMRSRGEFEFSNRLSLLFSTNSIRGNFDFFYAREEQIYEYSQQKEDQYVYGVIPFDIPDNVKKQTGFLLNLNGFFFSSDSVNIKASIEKYQYDTPSDLNNDDRDELHIMAECLGTHVLNKNLIFHVLLGINLTHLVYIYKERSADNNWNRVFRLKPYLTWHLFDRLSFISEYEVLANYYDYDFDEFLEGIRSFVFRRYFFRNFFRYNFSKATDFSFGFQGEKEEYGKLVWDRFTQNIINRRNTIALESRINYKPRENILLVSGAGYFSRVDERPGSHASYSSQHYNYYELNLGVTIKTKRNIEFSFLSNRRLINRSEGRDTIFQNTDLSIKWFY